MSADAKVWFDEDSDEWRGAHDSKCATGSSPGEHSQTAHGLVELLAEIEECENAGRPLRWVLRRYDNGLGLAGYIA